MNYDVVWKKRAEGELATIWLAAIDQASVTHAAEFLERILNRDPLGVGESRTSSVHRIACFPPLGVEYEVIVDDSRVIVHGVFSVG